MIHASAIAESIVAPKLFRPEFSHSLGRLQTNEISSTWEKDGAPADQLTIREVDEIPRPPSGKFQDMTSDFIRSPKFKSDDSG